LGKARHLVWTVGRRTSLCDRRGREMIVYLMGSNAFSKMKAFGATAKFTFRRRSQSIVSGERTSVLGVPNRGLKPLLKDYLKTS